MPEVPTPPDARDRPRIGVDEWVAEAEERKERYRGLAGYVQRGWDSLPPAGRLAALIVPAVVFPFIVSSQGNLFRYGLITLIYALLALGLNITVGFAGLLDLGYIAFFGCGAYFYGIMASGHSGNHFQAEIAIPLAMLGAALFGLLLGLSSRRLLGDYLAIVTLFFGQAFVIFVNNADRIHLPFVGTVDITGGSNGLDNIDPINLFGWKITTTRGYYFFSLAALGLIIVLLHFVNTSRIGRAWRALREDPLAAEVMSMPVNRLKILAFVFGAATAGFTGTIFGAVQTGAFPGDYDVGLLITIYAIVILGGLGSLGGVVIAALVINGVPELLRSTSNARWLFYGAIMLAILVWLRPWYRAAVVLAGTIAFGLATHAIVDTLWPRGTAGHLKWTGLFSREIHSWILLPTQPGRIAGWAYFGLIVVALALTMIKGWWRTLALIPAIYLAAFVWENKMIEQVSGATRLILLGALLVVVMNVRPQGFFGTSRVEIV
jgi:ABC-type branched-subunit amino acid transport system permease subunit